MPHLDAVTAAALAAALGLATAACSSTDDDGPVELRPQDGAFEALTYNVAGLPQALSGSDPEANIPQISPLLNGYDLVLVQEDFAYHEELAAEAAHPYQSVPKEIYYAAVHDGLNRFSLFSWTSFVRVQWVECYGSATTGSGDCLAEKGFSMARMVFGDGVTIDVYNHHADAGGGPEDIAARVAGFEQLGAYIQQTSAGQVVILAGDTNLHGDDPEDVDVLDRLKEQTGLADACEVLSCGDDRIDRFLFRDSDLIHLEPVAWEVAEEFVDAEGNDLSDHRAVHVAFEWHTR